MVVSSECGGHSKEVTEVGKEGKKGWRSGKEGEDRVGPCGTLSLSELGKPWRVLRRAEKRIIRGLVF